MSNLQTRPTKGVHRSPIGNVRRAVTPFALVVVLAAVFATVGFAEESEVVQLVRTLGALVDAGNADGVQEVCTGLEEIHQKSANNESRYALAYCRYRLATNLAGTVDNKKISSMLGAAQADLEEVVKTASPKSAEAVEAMSLLSGVMGYRIGVEPALGMSLGARSGQILSKAMRIDDENPRVHMQDGVSKFNTPKMWGGSHKKAEVALRKAVALFAENRPAEGQTAAWPDWGYMDTLAWLGQTLAAQDKVDEARAVYQQALAINPDMGWIRYQLMPALNSQ